LIVESPNQNNIRREIYIRFTALITLFVAGVISMTVVESEWFTFVFAGITLLWAPVLFVLSAILILIIILVAVTDPSIARLLILGCGMLTSAILFYFDWRVMRSRWDPFLLGGASTYLEGRDSKRGRDDSRS
jgi:hypothetical protein